MNPALCWQVLGSQSGISEEMEAQTLETIRDLKGRYSACVESVLTQVLSVVCDVKPELHANYRAAHERCDPLSHQGPGCL